MTGKTLLLLDLHHADRYRTFRNENYPFLRALLPSLGVETQRLSVASIQAAMHSDTDTLVRDLDAQSRSLLLDALARMAPTHVLVNERVAPDLWLTWKSALPQALFRMVHDGDVRFVLANTCQWLDLDATPLREGPNPQDTLTPDFRTEPLGPALGHIRPLLHLIVGPLCAFRRPLNRNPLYEHLDLHEFVRQDACAFCGVPDPAGQFPETAVVPLALRQIRAAEATAPWHLHDRDYVVRGAQLLPQLDIFARALIDAAVPPSTFRLSARLDELLRVGPRLRALLPELSRHGHRLHLWSVGIESFSPEENLRLNKGLAPDDVHRGVSLALALQREFPGAFHVEEFSSILYTPWTTLQDLRTNIAGYRQHGLDARGFFFGQRQLQILPDRPIAALARADGLLAGQFDDLPGEAACLIQWGQQQLPWRFRHREVALVAAVARRLGPAQSVPPTDTALRTVTAWRAALPADKQDRLDVLEALVQAAAAVPEDLSLHGILQRAGQRLGARPSRLWPRLARALSRLGAVGGLHIQRTLARPDGLDLLVTGPGLDVRVRIAAARQAEPSLVAQSGLMLQLPGNEKVSTAQAQALAQVLAAVVALALRVAGAQKPLE